MLQWDVTCPLYSRSSLTSAINHGYDGVILNLYTIVYRIFDHFQRIGMTPMASFKHHQCPPKPPFPENYFCDNMPKLKLTNRSEH